MRVDIASGRHIRVIEIVANYPASRRATQHHVGQAYAPRRYSSVSISILLLLPFPVSLFLVHTTDACRCRIAVCSRARVSRADRRQNSEQCSFGSFRFHGFFFFFRRCGTSSFCFSYRFFVYLRSSKIPFESMPIVIPVCKYRVLIFRPIRATDKRLPKISCTRLFVRCKIFQRVL